MATASPASDVYDAALGLPEAQRLDLAARLLESVDGPVAEDWDEAWLAELDRREEAARSGLGTGTAWSEVRARVRARIGAR